MQNISGSVADNRPRSSNLIIVGDAREYESVISPWKTFSSPRWARWSQQSSIFLLIRPPRPILRSGSFKSHQRNLILARKSSARSEARDVNLSLLLSTGWPGRVGWKPEENMLHCGDDESAEIHFFTLTRCYLPVLFSGLINWLIINKTPLISARCAHTSTPSHQIPRFSQHRVYQYTYR